MRFTTVETMIKTEVDRSYTRRTRKIYEMIENKVTDNLNMAVRKLIFSEIPFANRED